MPTTEEQIAELQARIAELEKAAKPPERIKSNHQRYDPFSQLKMPASAVAAMTDAVPDSLMRDICADNRRPANAPAQTAAKEPEQKGAG